MGMMRFVQDFCEERKRLLGLPKRKWEDIIKMKLQEVVWGHGKIDVAMDRDRWRPLVNAVMNFRVP